MALVVHSVSVWVCVQVGVAGCEVGGSVTAGAAVQADPASVPPSLVGHLGHKQ